MLKYRIRNETSLFSFSICDLSLVFIVLTDRSVINRNGPKDYIQKQRNKAGKHAKDHGCSLSTYCKTRV